jgi:hypothetical protein
MPVFSFFWNIILKGGRNLFVLRYRLVIAIRVTLLTLAYTPDLDSGRSGPRRSSFL